MFNVGGPEVLVILLLALIVLGPQRLPDAAKQIGKAMGELRRVSSGFQQELRSALDEPTEAAARQRGAALQASPASAPAVAPVEPAAPTDAAARNGTRPRAGAGAAARKAAPRKRTAPLRAPGKTPRPPAP